MSKRRYQRVLSAYRLESNVKRTMEWRRYPDWARCVYPWVEGIDCSQVKCVTVPDPDSVTIIGWIHLYDEWYLGPFIKEKK